MKELIKLENVTVKYPVIGRTDKRLSNVIINSVLGGKLTKKKKVFVTALDNVSLSIYSGTVVGIVGHNGSGKTTILRLISDVIKPESGQVTRNAKVCSLLTINLGMLDEATGYENIKIMARIKGVPRRNRKTYTENVERISDLGSYLYMPIRTYSSGMRLRLAFAISTQVDIDLLVLDEIVNVADKNFRDYILLTIDELIKGNKSLIIASHLEDLISKLSTRKISLEHGCIIKDELFEKESFL